MKMIRTLDDYLDKSCSFLLVWTVVFMLSFSFLSIIFRWFGLSFSWMEPCVRHLVFISTFLGGVLATGRGTHIGIDILGKVFETKGMVKSLMAIKKLIGVTSFLTVLWLMKASYDFMLVELEYGKAVFWGIHSGVLVGITPFGFGIIAMRFLLRLFIADEPQEAH